MTKLVLLLGLLLLGVSSAQAQMGPGSMMLSASSVNNSPPPTPGAILNGVGPTSLSFSSPAGQSSTAQTVNITNNGGNTLIMSFSFAGANPGDYSISSNTCGSTLKRNVTCSVGVIFNSPTVGTFTASLLINGS